jgi:hypothetical protein
MPEYRLGDDVDDFCIKCKRITNHAIVSLLNEEPAKVRCRTCYNDHDFRRCEIPPSKKDLKKAQLFQEVLAGQGAAPAVAEAAPEVAAEAATEAAETAESPAEQDVPSVEVEEAPKAKKGKKK